MTLPDAIDFVEADHPALLHIFRDIDAGIAAIIASDPAFGAKRHTTRRPRAKAQVSASRVKPRRARQAAA